MQNIDEWKPTKVIKRGPDCFAPNLLIGDSKSHYVKRLNIPLYIDYIRRYAYGSLLDCGCGQVPFYEVYKDQVEDIMCTDWQNSVHGSRHIDVYSDLNERLNFDNEQFDTIILTDVLEHIYTPGKLVHEIARVLRTGGKVIVAVPFLYRIHEEPHDYHRYTEYALRKMFEERGMSVISLEPYGKYLDVLGDTLNKVFFRGRKSAAFLFSLMRLIKKSGIGKKIDRAHGNSYALGYILCAEKTNTPVFNSSL